MTQNSLSPSSSGDAKNATSSSMTSHGARPRNHLSKDSRNSEAEIRKLQQQLQDIKEQVRIKILV